MRFARLCPSASAILRAPHLTTPPYPHHSMMFIDFADVVAQPKETVRAALKFVGADPAHPDYAFHSEPPGMQGKPRGRKMDPAVKDYLRRYYRASNIALRQMLNKPLSWFDEEL